MWRRFSGFPLFPVSAVSCMAAGEGQVNALLVWGKEKVKQTRSTAQSPPFSVQISRLFSSRSALAGAGHYDSSRRISQTDGGRCFALPITTSAVAALLAHRIDHKTGEDTELPLSNYSQMAPVLFNGLHCVLTHAELPQSKSAVGRAKTPRANLKFSLERLLRGLEPQMTSESMEKLISELPTSWERHGDCVVLPHQAFNSREWKEVKSVVADFWGTVAAALACSRLAQDSEIARDGFRSSRAILLRGSDPWVQHLDNGIRYTFDVTKIMFSSGNITEKLRVAEFDCRGEVVVDMFAGIGYFTLPFLVHAHADTVHACDWNPAAVEGLKRGLVLNGVREKCVILYGDCREVSSLLIYSFTCCFLAS